MGNEIESNSTLPGLGAAPITLSAAHFPEDVSPKKVNPFCNIRQDRKCSVLSFILSPEIFSLHRFYKVETKSRYKTPSEKDLAYAIVIYLFAYTK